ncbi:MAG: acyltransferase [Lachnospiraceae bacterium]|nr:acyltransferase [Lachnospiraceae bacterium]
MAEAGKRKIEYEKIRVCAMLFMVLFHCRGSLGGFIDTAGERYLNDGLTLLFITCNSLFFMLSGKFALASKCETVSDYRQYYGKKLTNIVVPALVYMFLRSLLEYGGRFWEISFWKTYVRNVCYDYAGTEYWFLYTVLGLLLLAPLLNKMAAHLKKGEMWLLIGFGLVFHAIRTYAPYVNLSFSWQYIFGGWAFYFMLGFFLEKVIDTPEKENLVIATGGMCFLISMIQKQFGFISNIHNLAPTFTMISCAVFFLLKRNYFRKGVFLQRIIMKIGRYSFAVYLIHNPIRDFLFDHIPHVSETAYLPNLFELAVCTLAVSFLLAFICENTVVRAVQWVVGRIVYPKKREIKQVLQ